LRLIRLEFRIEDGRIGVMQGTVPGRSAEDKPKLLDQRVKASLTRQEWHPTDALRLCTSLRKWWRILHWVFREFAETI